MNKIILVGAGGHCKSCIDVIEDSGKYKIIGLVDKNKIKRNLFNYPILGNDKNLKEIRKISSHAFVTVGQIRLVLVKSRHLLRIFNLFWQGDTPCTPGEVHINV